MDTNAWPSSFSVMKSVTGLSTQKVVKVDVVHRISSDHKCSLCFDTSQYFVTSDCDHPTCLKCFLTIRLLLKKVACSLCRSSQLAAIISIDPNKKYCQFNGSDHQFYTCIDGLKSEVDNMDERITRIVGNVCPKCYRLYSSMDELKYHLLQDHDLRFCQVCLDNLQVFPRDHRTFSEKSLYVHQKYGEKGQSEENIHKLCNVCRVYFFDKPQLDKHVLASHRLCYLCDYYCDTQKEFSNHLNKKHFSCPLCGTDTSPSVFATLGQLQHHKLASHGHELDKFERQSCKIIELPPTAIKSIDVLGEMNAVSALNQQISRGDIDISDQNIFPSIPGSKAIPKPIPATFQKMVVETHRSGKTFEDEFPELPGVNLRNSKDKHVDVSMAKQLHEWNEDYSDRNKIESNSSKHMLDNSNKNQPKHKQKPLPVEHKHTAFKITDEEFPSLPFRTTKKSPTPSIGIPLTTKINSQKTPTAPVPLSLNSNSKLTVQNTKMDTYLSEEDSLNLLKAEFPNKFPSLILTKKPKSQNFHADSIVAKIVVKPDLKHSKESAIDSIESKTLKPEPTNSNLNTIGSSKTQSKSSASGRDSTAMNMKDFPVLPTKPSNLPNVKNAQAKTLSKPEQKKEPPAAVGNLLTYVKSSFDKTKDFDKFMVNCSKLQKGDIDPDAFLTTVSSFSWNHHSRCTKVVHLIAETCPKHELKQTLLSKIGK